ncbi:uncharacterized protein LOC134825066 [Bolinopsis microptera]|uniref:uncharacterized protein LOC134825066 n=1 Tax=Bolinopsis microptera TaxID=2820187 RepID=UPI003078B1B4
MSGGVTAGVNMSDKHNPARAVPVRVKKKTLKKLSNAERLEMENAKMEERLRTLRKTIEKEKEERSNCTSLWKSGQTGAITNFAKEHSSKNKSAGIKLGDKKIKVKFLTPVVEKGESREKQRKAAPRVSTPHNSSTTAGSSWAEPQTSHQGPAESQRSEALRPEALHADAPRADAPHTETHSFEMQRMPRESMAWSEVGEMEGLQRQASIVGPVCGQCELNGAQMNCMECGEKYCTECFAMFHKKGALKSHTSRPLTRQANLALNSGPARQVKIEEPIQENSLWGDYDEDASAAGFMDAVKAWRGEEVTTNSTGNQQTGVAGKTTDGSQTAKGAIPDINFSENENVSYFERMLLKKQKETVEDDIIDSEAKSEYSAGEITVSQLDFCRDLLAHNIEEDRKSRMEAERPESVIEIVEVNSNIGYLEEIASCVVEESPVCSDDEDDVRGQMEMGRALLSTVKIEEYSPRGTDNPTTAGIFQHNGFMLIEPVDDPIPETASPFNPDLAEQLIRESVTSIRGNAPTITTPRARSITPRATTPSRSHPGPQDRIVSGETRISSPNMMSSSGRVTSPGRISSPQLQERPYTPPKVDRSHDQPLSVRSSFNRSGRNYTESTRSPLIRRMPTNPEITRASLSGAQENELKRPLTADVKILSSQAWRQSFLGFVKSGLPGYTLPSTPPPEELKRKEKKEKKEEVMLRGPPSWCPGESCVGNEIFQSRENSVTFPLAEEAGIKRENTNSRRQLPPPNTAGKFERRSVEAERRSNVIQCDDLNTPTNLEYESEDVLAALGKELDVSKSRDLGDYLNTLRHGTPDAVTLLTHQDRMSQLDMESRGMTPTATPLITPRITTRESLFLDFEDVEKQIMAGEDVENIQ